MNKHEATERQDWVLEPPLDFSVPYELGGYDDVRVRQIMYKYLERRTNLARAWTRICHHFPETTDGETPLSCLEFGTAHGAMLEIWRAYGHDVVGTDFPWRAGNEVVRAPHRPWQRAIINSVSAKVHENPIAEPVEGWTYQPIIESLNLDVRLMDGRKWPYAFEDKSFDVVCAYQAIDAFAPPERWTEVVAEFCRIARRGVVIGYNPLPLSDAEIPDRKAAAHQAWMSLSKFSVHGLRTVFTEFGRTRRGFHPVAMKFLPDV